MNDILIKVKLKPGKEKHILKGHPLVFSGAIEPWEREVTAGQSADVYSSEGAWIARGLVHPTSAIAVRIYTWQQTQSLDGDFFARQIERAAAFRQSCLATPGFLEKTDAYRLVFSESDGLSGLIVDRYAGTLVVHVGSGVLTPYLEALLGALRKATGASRLVVKADEDSIEREKLDPAALQALSDPVEGPVRIRENGFAFDVDVQAGQKTGFFLDQRANCARVAAYAAGRTVLSAYCYTGGFEVYAAASGAARITGLDRSEPALVRARENCQLNRISVPIDYLRADVPEMLRKYRDMGRSFDLIILDPPRFVSNRAQKEKGMRAYKDINLLALKLLTPGGILATFSCSGQISIDDFKTMLAWATSDSGKTVRILETLSQPPDHPILALFPESEYLKGLICRAE
ncbi:MAG: class I SAM-dependent rRNA methyltransferase [Lentisphaerota bacterium]